MQQLRKKIAAILSQAVPEGPIYSYNSGLTGADNEQLRLLRVLYAQSSPELRKQFALVLLNQLTFENAQHVCHAILDIDRVTHLNHILLAPNTPTPIVEQVLHALEERLRIEPHKFSDQDLDDLELTLRHVTGVPYKPTTNRLNEALELPVVIERIAKTCKEVRQRINTARYAHVKKELLEGVNPEINIDKEALLSRLETIGFRHTIATALEEAEKKLTNAATSVDFKAVMDLVRTIYEEVFEDAAHSVAKVRNKTISSGSHFKPFREFLVNEEILNSDEGELSQKLYNYLSNYGSHALGSAPEQARLTKNIVIELCLLVLGRVQQRAQ